MSESGKKTERALLTHFRQLPDADRKTLLDLAEFLAQRAESAGTTADLPEPERIPRPAGESVIKAIKRLSASYSMLDRSKMLNETSALMAQHVMHGREAHAVIDELEQLFADHYDKLKTVKSARSEG